MQTSTFTPGTSNEGQTLEEILGGNDGVFGELGTPTDARYVVIQGVCFARDLESGDFTERVTSVPDGTRFARITGTLELTLTS